MGKPFFTYKYKGFGGCESVCDLEVYGNLVIATERGVGFPRRVGCRLKRSSLMR